MRPRPDSARRAAALLGLAATLALALPTPAVAQGVSFGAPGRLPREHDTDIGAKTTGDPSLDYVLHCQGCHQAGGVGLPGAVPQLKDSVARFASIPGGREYLSRVPGVAQSQLDDAAIAALLNWMLPYFDATHLPAGFRPFTADEVGPLRRRPLVAASAMRASLLEGSAPAR